MDWDSPGNIGSRQGNCWRKGKPGTAEDNGAYSSELSLGKSVKKAFFSIFPNKG